MAMLCGSSNCPGSVPLPPHQRDERAVLRILHDARVGALAVGDEDVAVPRNDEIGDAVERIARFVLADDPFTAERHQQLALGTELEDLMVAPIGDPDIPLAIGPQEMCRLEHPLAPRPQELAVLVERHDRHRLVAMEDVDVSVARIDVDAGGRAPRRDPCGKRRPVLDHLITAFGALRARRAGEGRQHHTDHGHDAIHNAPFRAAMDGMERMLPQSGAHSGSAGL